jgi:hypothetical protein
MAVRPNLVVKLLAESKLQIISEVTKHVKRMFPTRKYGIADLFRCRIVSSQETYRLKIQLTPFTGEGPMHRK